MLDTILGGKIFRKINKQKKSKHPHIEYEKTLKTRNHFKDVIVRKKQAKTKKISFCKLKFELKTENNFSCLVSYNFSKLHQINQLKECEI